jgi:hypothetical protein
VLAGKLAIPFSSLPRQLSTKHTLSLCTAAVQSAFTEMYITKILIAMSLKMAATCTFYVCLYVHGTGSDQVSLSQHKYFLFGELLKFGSFFDDAFCKNIGQKICMPKRLKELFVGIVL